MRPASPPWRVCSTERQCYHGFMDFSAGAFLASIVVSGAGTVALVYGKRQRRMPHLAVGIIMIVFPYLLSSWLLILLIGALLLGLLYMAVRMGW